MTISFHYFARLTFVLLFSSVITGGRSLGDTLPPLAADISRTTVSGLSSGAYMAGQFQVANSRIIKGAALVAGGPYGCARTPGSEFNPYWPAVLSWNLARAVNKCMEDGWFFSSVPNAEDLFDFTAELAAGGKIDPVENLKDDKIYLFSSRADDTVERGVVEEANDFYTVAGIAPDNLQFVKQETPAHAFLTEDKGLKCGETGPPFINDCDYDQAGELLKALMGPLNPPDVPSETSYIRFKQQPFLAGLAQADFDADGMAYIPQSCRSQANCAVHVVFHGCRQGLEAVNDRFIRETGYARWAESNRIVVLFPQVKSSALNPNGCWDWWGYTGSNFLEKDAPQMIGVMRMVERLAALP